MRVPNSFRKVSVKDYQEIVPIYKQLTETEDSEVFNDCWDNILAILSDSQLDTIQELPFKKRTKYLNRISWLTRPLNNYGVKKYIFINGTLHKAVLDAKDFNVAQYIEIKTFLQRGDVVSELHNLLASIYMPLTFKGFRHDGVNHSKRAEAFKLKKVGKVYPTVFFYSKVLKNSTEAIMDYGLQQTQKIIDQVLMEIAKEGLESIGDGK